MQRKKLIIIGQGTNADWAKPHIDALVRGEVLAEEGVVRGCGLDAAMSHVWEQEPQLVVFAETPTGRWDGQQLEALWEEIRKHSPSVAVAFAPPHADCLSEDASRSKLWLVVDRAQRERGGRGSLYEAYCQIFCED